MNRFYKKSSLPWFIISLIFHNCPWKWICQPENGRKIHDSGALFEITLEDQDGHKERTKTLAKSSPAKVRHGAIEVYTAKKSEKKGGKKPLLNTKQKLTHFSQLRICA